MKFILPLLTTLSCAAAIQSTLGADRPNVILILIDDQGYGDFSCHGNPVLKTPHMDALAAEGVRFTDFHVSSWCSPTRAALLTGRHCRKVGVHGTNRTDQHLAVEAVTMADLFQAGGYATGIFGKWHLGDRYPLRPMDRGFDESVVFPDGAVTTAPDYWGNDYYDDTYLHNDKPRQYKGYCTDVWFDLALEFIEKNKDRPFFCYLPTNSAHAPFLVDEKYAKPYRNDPRVPNAQFYGMIAQLDERIGRFRARLAELGLDKNTILVFLGDNGTAAGGFNAGMRGKKTSPYDGGHRVACFMHYPDGGISGGRTVDQLAAHIDLLPTLIDLTGLVCKPKKPDFDGHSLKSSLLGQNAADDNRVLIESFHRVAMTPRWRLVNDSELYDIRQDPAQQQDVAKQFPAVVARLRGELRAYRETEDHRPHLITVGSDKQNPVTLTSEDWKANVLLWQHSISRLPKHDPGSLWNVQVAQAGRYELSLRRWPRETETAINAALPKEKWCWQMTNCEKIAAEQAVVRAGEVELTTTVADDTEEAKFIVELAAGNTTLQGYFKGKGQQTWCGPYLYVRKLENGEQQ